MMKRSTTSPPLFFQSKLLCFSLLYFTASLFFALYLSLSSTKCLFRSSPFDPVQAPLFTYPSSYGEHKYAIPTVRSSCNSPIFFSDYWDVLKEIESLSKNQPWTSRSLRYMKGNNAVCFGGNFSIDKRISYYDHDGDNSNIDVPCGFLKPFPVSDFDRIAMENCRGVVVVSAIFGDHDKIRQPKGLGSKTQEHACFFMFADDATLKGLDSHNLITINSSEYRIGVWRVIRVASEGLYDSPAMNGVIPKYLVHRLFLNSKFSIWIDAKLQLMVDPLLLLHTLVVSQNVDMAISKHPYYVHTMEEAMATARWKKWWNVDGLKTQMESYCENGLRPWTPSKLPYTSDVPDSALILRKHGTKSNLFSCLLFNELEAYNPRDQLAFAYVRDKMKSKTKINMFEVEVFEQVVVEFRHNLKRSSTSATSPNNSGRQTKRASFDSFVNGSCEKYLSEMWSETRD